MPNDERSWAAVIKRVLQNTLLVGLGCVLSLVMIEIVLRVFNPFDFRIKGDEILLPANMSYNIANPGVDKLDERILHSKNSLGFRGAEPPAELTSSLSIITVGGSTTESFYLSDGDPWPAVLGRGLADNFDGLWMNNAGFDGHSSFGHIVLFKDYLAHLRPKVVIFLVGANDMASEGLNFFDKKVMRDPTSLRGFGNWLAGYSETVALGLNLIRYAMTWWIGVAHLQTDLAHTPRIKTKDAHWLRLREEHLATHIPRFKKRLQTLVDLARRHRVMPVFLTQPALYGSGVDPTSGIALDDLKVSDLDGRTQWRLLELYNDATRSFGGHDEVFVIDLATQMAKDSKYYYDFLHHTKAGAAELARIVDAALCPVLAAKFVAHLKASCP
ncbi:MAG: SGNH/GDSL hydrolase family protein [Pseudomonadota bacterium]